MSEINQETRIFPYMPFQELLSSTTLRFWNKEAPPEAAAMSASATSARKPVVSLSTTQPMSAAMAGSRLINTPNTRAGSSLSASSSSEKGMMVESTATPHPGRSTLGSSRARGEAAGEIQRLSPGDQRNA